MGLGDPYHKHPLRTSDPLYNDIEHLQTLSFFFCPWRSIPQESIAIFCYHCELPIAGVCYECKDCNYYIHKLCQDLPITLRLPLHDQHLLTRFEPPPNSSSSDSSILLCNECQKPCLGRFAYYCNTCHFYFHLKCLFTLNHEKHDHPLLFGKERSKSCKICRSHILNSYFGCQSCEFYIHHECSLIPLEVKCHHIHKLTLRHQFPEECDQVYCDLCEDRDGEMNRQQSYYYCKECDYIAHVNCCITQPCKDVLLCERFTHEHPLRHEKSKPLLCCNQCSYNVSEDSRECPSLVKHPGHTHHLVTGQSSFGYLICTECHFLMHGCELSKFSHPLWKHKLKFKCTNSQFRCDACGELGKGSRVGYYDKFELDLHLECFALPGKLENESHKNHPLYLRWLGKSAPRYCSVCLKEMDPQLWFYFCQECNFAAHMDCVARDLLLTLRSSIKNQPDFCAIFEPDERFFKYRKTDIRPLMDPRPSYSIFFPVLEVGEVSDDDEGNCAEEYRCDLATDLGIETVGYVLACPKCNSLIATQAAYSTIKDWKSSFLENSISTADDPTPSESEPLNFLEEPMIDELCCSICHMLIFPPTYSCGSCQIFFHKSCAELPRKIVFNKTTYVLVAPPFREGLSNCSYCEYPISSLAYLSSAEGIIFDVQCASGAPLVNPTFCESRFLFSRVQPFLVDESCAACKKKLEIGTFIMDCIDKINFYLHPECGLLPAVIKHKIHQHPLELATDLAELYDEYVCDVCEKDLNPNLWAYRCVDSCGIRATSHVSCVITSKKKCHFSYDQECQNMTEEEKLEFRRKAKARGIRL